MSVPTVPVPESLGWLIGSTHLERSVVEVVDTRALGVCIMGPLLVCAAVWFPALVGVRRIAPAPVTHGGAMMTASRPHHATSSSSSSSSSSPADRMDVRLAALREPASGSAEVIIAGGGIGGLCTALTLRKLGYHVRVFEKTQRYRPFGGPIQIASNAAESSQDRAVLQLYYRNSYVLGFERRATSATSRGGRAAACGSWLMLSR